MIFKYILKAQTVLFLTILFNIRYFSALSLNIEKFYLFMPNINFDYSNQQLQIYSSEKNL